MPRLRFLRSFPLFALIACGLSAPAAAGAMRALSLEQCMQLALVHNPDMRLARLGELTAAANVVTAAAAPNPTLTLQTFNLNPHAGFGAGPWRAKTVDSTVRLDQLIERGGKRGLRTEVARALALASGDDSDDMRRQLRLAVSQAYYGLMAARDRLQIARQSADLFDASTEVARKRQRAGDLAAAEVARVEVDALRARNDVQVAETDLLGARQALALLLGDAAEAAAVEPADPWPQALPPPANSLLAARPDLQAAQRRLDAALAGRKLAYAARSADITVGFQAEHFPASAANTQGSGNSYGIAVQVPLALRYDYQGEIRAAEVAVDSAQENLDRLRQAAQGEVLVSAARVASAHARLRRDRQELLPAAQRAADAAEFAFARGALGMTDLLDVRRSYRSAQLEALGAQADYAQSLAAARAAAPDQKER